MNIKNQIFQGDSAKVLFTLPENSVDLIVTSPPYDAMRDYKGFTFDFKTIADGMHHVLKEGGVLVWVVNDGVEKGSKTGTCYEQALYFRDHGFVWHDTMIYRKSHSIYPSKSRYWQVFEYMFVFSKTVKPKTINLIKDRRNKNYGRLLTGEDRQVNGTFNTNRSKRTPVIGTFGVRHNVWDIEIGNNKTTKDRVAYKHPAIFPESLARDHIITWSNPGDIVLDPMAGSGTVLKQAKLLGRDYCGIELSQEYIDEIIKPRLAATKITKKLEL